LILRSDTTTAGATFGILSYSCIAQEAHARGADRHDDPIGAIRGSEELERLRRLQIMSVPVEGVVGVDRTECRARLGCLTEGEDV
jgi:hypothetical protein